MYDKIIKDAKVALAVSAAVLLLVGIGVGWMLS